MLTRDGAAMWFIDIELTFGDDDQPDDARPLGEFLTDAYVEFCKLDVIDPELLAVVGESKATFSQVVTGDDYNAAISHAVVAVRTALHAAGGSTAGWPELPEVVDAALARPRVVATPVPA